MAGLMDGVEFLSIQAQDFIEETPAKIPMPNSKFLSIQAQDFIEEAGTFMTAMDGPIPEHSSSGLH